MLVFSGTAYSPYDHMIQPSACLQQSAIAVAALTTLSGPGFGPQQDAKGTCSCKGPGPPA